MNFLIEFLGWLGMALIVSDYAAISYHFTEPGLAYQLVNIAGCAALGTQLYVRRVWPPFGLQVVWTLIAIIAIVRMLWQ